MPETAPDGLPRTPSADLSSPGPTTAPVTSPTATAAHSGADGADVGGERGETSERVVVVTAMPSTPSVPSAPQDPYAAVTGVLAALDAGTSGEVGVERSSEEVLEEAVQRWLLAYKPNTAASYRLHLGRWFTFCRSRGHDPLTVDAGVVREFQTQVKADNLPGTATAKLAPVRSFYRFVVEDRVLDEDPAAGGMRRAPGASGLAASLAVAGQERTVDQLAAGFLLSYSRNTRKSYETVLRLWFSWCLQVGVEPLKVQRPHVDAFRAVLDERYKPATVNQRIVVIRTFYTYCIDVGALTANPARGVRGHRMPNVSSGTGVDREEAQELLRAARIHDPCYHALFTLLLLNGLRISEALTLDVEDLSTVRGHQVIMVQRKGFYGSQQAVPLAPRTGRVIADWLAVRPERLAPGQGWTEGTGPMFLNRRGVRLARNSAWNTLRKLAVTAAPTKADTLHPHDLRNAFVTLSLDAGVPLRDVQDSAGHASADTTRRYDTGRNNLDRNATYTLSAYLGGGQ